VAQTGRAYQRDRANYEHRRELDTAAVAAAKFIATDDTEQVRYESTTSGAGARRRAVVDDVHSLAMSSPQAEGPHRARDITLFKSLGVAIETSRWPRARTRRR